MKQKLIHAFPFLLAGVFLFTSGLVNAQTIRFQNGSSMRNKQLSHYYKMVTWDSSPYQEEAYWLASSGGGVIEFMNWRMVFPPGYSPSNPAKYPMIIML